MVAFRYRAYISYSHRDEAWAKWLQRALETYRVPRKLRGTHTSVGEVPPGISPVFRDREELSSAADLSSTVKQALAESENLIVVCSLEAAASRWVGEEIREFGSLGRQQKIFCVIVDGEPDPKAGATSCFPSALAEIGLLEPLAADVRKWADGKQLAKLKLIAGLLGIRLDDLRQRELQRHRKLMTAVGLGAMAALTLVLFTVASQISKQQEREKAEQMATFIVELGEKLQPDTDLETLATISAQAAKYFQSLEPDNLTPETGKKVALAMRQLAQISQLQGKPEESLRVFQGSKNILARLNKNYPEIPDLLFELGNANFHIGNLYFRLGRYGDARASMQSYQRLTRNLLDSDPGNPDWIMELAYAHHNLAALQLDSGLGIDEVVLENLEEAIRLMEIVLELKPDDEVVVSDYANTLAYAADAQSLACQLDDAMSLRSRSRELAEILVQSDPGNNGHKERYAYAISGLANIHIQQGKLDSAKQNLQMAISMLQQLSSADPSHVVYRHEALYLRVTLARVIAESGGLDAARSMLQLIEPEFELTGQSAGQDAAWQDEYADFLLTYADVEFRTGNTQAADNYLQAMISLFIGSDEPRSWDQFEREKLLLARYQWWEVNGQDAFDTYPRLAEVNLDSVGALQSCTEAAVTARMHVLEGHLDEATAQVAYLQDRAYADPGFVRFCNKYKLCGE